MELTAIITKVVGPVLVLRAVSILLDRRHFRAMLDGLEQEVATISFSLFPVALLMTCLTLLAVHTDTSSGAALVIRVMAWGGVVKASALILFPHLVVPKAQALGRAGFLPVVVVVSAAVGGYFTWFGYFA